MWHCQGLGYCIDDGYISDGGGEQAKARRAASDTDYIRSMYSPEYRVCTSFKVTYGRKKLHVASACLVWLRKRTAAQHNYLCRYRYLRRRLQLTGMLWLARGATTGVPKIPFFLFFSFCLHLLMLVSSARRQNPPKSTDST